jgi:hypothetical protein
MLTSLLKAPHVRPNSGNRDKRAVIQDELPAVKSL